MAAKDRPATTGGATPTAARASTWPSTTSSAAIPITPAATALVTRYPDTFSFQGIGWAVV